MLTRNLELSKYMISHCLINVKKALKVPGLYATQSLNRLFPLILALSQYQGQAWHQDMFTFFWEEIGGYLWNEDSLEGLIKVLARRELADLLPQVF